MPILCRAGEVFAEVGLIYLYPQGSACAVTSQSTTCSWPGLGCLRRDHNQVKGDLFSCSPGRFVIFVQFMDNVSYWAHQGV